MAMAASAAVLCLAGCQSAPDTPPQATCDQASLQSTMDDFFQDSQTHLDSFDKLDCSGDWALVQATVTEDAGKPGAQTFIFVRSGENWILKAPEIVCGSPTADNSRPADAQVPVDLWPKACLIP